jgi:DNA modification methylase
METSFIPISKIQCNTGQILGLPKNPRLIKDNRYEKLVKSIKDDPEMMELRELIVYPQGDVFVTVCGNMRFHAMQDLKYTECPCKVLPIETSVKKLKAYTIKDNIPFGEDDMDLLANEWDSDFLADCGFEIDNLFNAYDKASPDTPDPQAPSKILLDKWGVKPGDVWELGQHRIICGDSSIEETVSSILGQNKPTLIFTDPPYGVGIGSKNKMLDGVGIGSKNKMLDGVGKSGRVTENIAGDGMDADTLKAMLLKVFTLCKNYMAEDCSVFVCSPQGGGLGMMMMMMMMQESGLEIRHIINWVKSSATFSMGRLDYDYQHEPILFTWGKKHKKIMAGEFKTSLWPADKPRACDLHPTMKPIELYLNAILNHTDKDNVIYEPFSGSGTAILAAEKTERICRAIEIDPQYVAVAIQRWVDLTGGTPKKLSQEVTNGPSTTSD